MATLREGDLVDGKYRLVRFLGGGGWANVYEGLNERIGRRVAIKFLHESASVTEAVLERFQREARATTRIDSEHTVQVFDLGVLADGRPYMVMELLQGESLGARVARGEVLPETTAVLFAVHALRGLSVAHAAGVIHRDVKPDNMVVVKTRTGDDLLKVVDFGISKVLDAGLEAPSMTQPNTILGSPVYMSPEQCRGGRDLDHRSDLYSLGVVVFELLTGKHPHDGETLNELIFKIALEDARDLSTLDPKLDPELCAIVMKMLARDRQARFQSADEAEVVLLAWAERRGIDTSRWGAPGSAREATVDSVTSSARVQRAGNPTPIELADTHHGTPSGPAGLPAASSSGGRGSPASLAQTAASEVEPASRTANTTTLDELSTSTTGEGAERRRLSGWTWGGVGLVLVLGGGAWMGGAVRWTGSPAAKDGPAVSAPPPLAAPVGAVPSAVASTGDPPSVAPPVPASASAEPLASLVPTARPPIAPKAKAVPRSTTGTGGAPPATADQAAGSASSPDPTPVPSPSASVVGGRRIRTKTDF